MDRRLAGHTRDFFDHQTNRDPQRVRSCNDVFRAVVLQSGNSRDRRSKVGVRSRRLTNPTVPDRSRTGRRRWKRTEQFTAAEFLHAHALDARYFEKSTGRRWGEGLFY